MDGGKLIKIIAFGDSITEGTYGGAPESRVWTTVLGKMFARSDMKVQILNSGIPGETAPFGLKRFSYHVLAKQPDIVLIMYGANDSYDPYGTGNPAVSIDDFGRAVDEMITQALNQNILSVLMTTTPLYLSDDPGDHQNALLAEYMGKIREIAEHHEISIIDHFAAWMDRVRQGEDVKKYLPDGAHPDERGNQIIAETIYNPLTKIIEKV